MPLSIFLVQTNQLKDELVRFLPTNTRLQMIQWYKPWIRDIEKLRNQLIICCVVIIIWSQYASIMFYQITLSGGYGNVARWRHQIETFSALLAICAGNSPVTGEFPAQWPVTRSFDVIFDMRLNKQLRKQSRGWWSETPSHPLWRHCNVSYGSI